MLCRLFWASYFSQSMKDEECDQLKKQFVMEYNIGHIAKHWQLSPEDHEVYSTLTKHGEHVIDTLADWRSYFDQILEDLAKENEDNVTEETYSEDNLMETEEMVQAMKPLDRQPNFMSADQR